MSNRQQQIQDSVSSDEDFARELTGPGGRFEIVTEIVNGFDMQVYKDRHRSLVDLLVEAERFGDKTALVQGDLRLSFAEFVRRVRILAGELADSGITPGDRVALVSANSPNWLIAFWATLACGAISVPLNAWWTADEIAFALADSGACLVFCDTRREPLVAEHHDIPRIAFDDGFSGRFADRPADVSWPSTTIAEDDPAVLLYTSGTTGRPKAAVQTHRNTIANLQNMTLRTALNAAGERERKRRGASTPDTAAQRRTTTQSAWLVVVPLFHVTGLFTQAVPALAIGGKLVFMPPGRFGAETALDLVETEKVTILSGVPTMMQRILGVPDDGSRDLSSLRQISYGGAPAPPGLGAALGERFPWIASGRPTLAYGLTESAGVICSNSGEDLDGHPGSCGRPMPTMQLRIVDEYGTEAPAGERGEICAKGPIIVPGYWNRPEETSETFQDGWLHTGDIGRIDDDGFLFILDRAKDMVIRGGENVYCAEVEDAISTLDEVSECAVFGQPDDDWGEKVCAVVVVNDNDAVTPEAVTEHCKRHLAHFKVPTRITITDVPLPRNPTGKVVKSVLRSGQAPTADAESDSAL